MTAISVSFRADFGSEDFNGNVSTYTNAYRPDSIPVIVLDLPEVPSDPGDPGAPIQTPRKLVGVEYPVEWIGTDGRGNAQVEAYWYGPMGKKNASLRVMHAEAIDSNNTRIDYTIDRMEYNGYGQVEVEHKYGYSVDLANATTLTHRSSRLRRSSWEECTTTIRSAGMTMI